MPRQAQEETIKTVGRSSHGGRATRVVGDIFGCAYLVFPPQDMHPDIQALVCSSFTDATTHLKTR